MKIVQNSFKRYDVEGLLDSEKAGKKAGIAGYQSKFIGWLAMIFCKAVAVKTENGTVYLNRNSLAKWHQRIAPSVGGIDRKMFSNSKLVEAAVDRLLLLKKELVENKRVKEPELEDLELPLVSYQNLVFDYDKPGVGKLLQAFKDKELLGDDFEKVNSTVLAFSNLTRWKIDDFQRRFSFEIYPERIDFNTDRYSNELCRFYVRKSLTYDHNPRYEVGLKLKLVETFNKSKDPAEKKSILLNIADKMQEALDLQAEKLKKLNLL